MSSMTVLVFSPPKFKDGEMVSGPMQSAETEQLRNEEQFQNKIDSLSIRQVFYKHDTPSNAGPGDTSILTLFGKDRDKAWVLVFFNTGDTGPGLDIL